MKILIVGGVAGGASAAARARRLSEDAEIILFERGEYISFANCGLPYYIGGEITDRDNLLVQTPEKMRARFNIDVRINSEVVAIDKDNKTITVFDKINKKQYQETYDALVLSPGAKPIRPNLPGIDDKRIFSLRNIPDMDAIDTFINTKNAKTAVVVGGGYIGLEMIEALKHRGIAVTLVELLDQVMAPIDKEMAGMLHQELSLHGVKLELGTSVAGFEPTEDKLNVNLSSGAKLAADFVILAIGVKPENDLAKAAGLKVGELGGIAVNSSMQTSDSNIYAVGDAVEITELVSGKPALIPLAGPANRQGRIAANNIFGRASIYNKTQGTGVCKVFNQTAAMTGLNEKLLQKFKSSYDKIYVHPFDHASYYPGAVPVSLKLLFDPKNGRILGAQAVGMKGVEKRIDLLATAIRGGLTVFDLEEMELCYAPPYGSAKDIVNQAGFTAANVIKGDVKNCHVADIVKPTDRQFLLDVRTPEEFAAGTLANAVNIPVDDLRAKLNEIPKDKELLVFCKAGLRGYIACRILTQHGFNCRNLSGGYTTYQFAQYQPIVTATVTTNFNEEKPMSETLKVDARGLQCPGPIQQLKKAVDKINIGEAVEILTTDPGFLTDAPAWCQSTGNEVINIEPQDGAYCTTIRKVGAIDVNESLQITTGAKNMTIVVFSNDFDKAIAAFIIANGAIAMGFKVTLFFTFWGLNILRKDKAVKVKKNLIEKMFGFMMPRGAKKLALSKMNMMGMGKAMIKMIMRKKNVASLPELIASAISDGVDMVACGMSMDLMGIKPEELLDGISSGGVAAYLNEAGHGGVNLFI